LALSFSPELFFALEGGRLTTRPMKGTARRAPSPEADRAAAAALAADAKNRAENLMIVDLLRNDLSRVAQPGSVAVDRLFEVETYPTIHQMTSTVSARLREEADAVDVIEALFPCGSVTGAPKIRAMEVIAEVERQPRGLYTGSIGAISADGSAAFNVAIRTLVLADGRASLGLGAGIVADSDAESEWAECLSKAAFLTQRTARFDLIETLRYEPGAGLARLDGHLARLRASAAYWGFAVNEAAVRTVLDEATRGVAAPSRIRLVVGRSGSVAVQVGPLPPCPTEPVRVALAALPVAANDPRLAHKTSDRDFYDGARRAAGAFEVLFVDAGGRLTEGSFTNLFVPRHGRLATPPLAAGLLPGVLRAELLASSEAFEAELTPADLAGGFLIGNSLRGLLRARLARPVLCPAPSFRA
jgi:para-aminobenzoate synthetase/4-amino-4-deoxychorismate lyase